MKSYTLIFIALLTASCSSTSSQEKATSNIEPFGIEFNLTPNSDSTFNLWASIILNEGDFIISPFSPDKFFLSFK